LRHDVLFRTLKEVAPFLYDASRIVQQDVIYIPIRPIATTEEEAQHLASSFVGLTSFWPVDIYSDCVVNTPGLLKVLKQLMDLEGFGVAGHRRFGLYSILHVDVTIFWQLLRVFYSYSGLAPVRNDLFLCFGLWHAYHYAHIALWHEYRATFLAPAFFALFPREVLLRRPKLLQSVTFFSWLRLTYPHIRVTLQDAILNKRKELLDWEVKQLQAVREGKLEEKKSNPHRQQYIHLLNLQTLFEFCIPVIQDYGLALKSNDWKTFKRCYQQLFLLLFFY